MIKGMDLSHWDGTVVWIEIPDDIKFVGIKVSEGGWPFDELAWQHHIGAGQEHILRMAYHFWRYGTNPNTQASEYITRVNWLEAQGGKFELGLVMDAEDTRAPKGVGHLLARHLDTCLQSIDNAYGQLTKIYTAEWWWHEWMMGWKDKWRAAWPNLPLPDFSKRLLWVADYTATPPAQPHYMPRDWSSWVFWQYSDWAEIPGIAENDEDVDVFNGTFEQLLAMAQDGTPPVTTFPYNAKTIASSLNVRKGPSVTYGKYGPLSPGTSVVVYEEKDGWARISEEPTHQWVSLAYTKKV